MIISKTPFRISFAGGGSDLKSYYKHSAGAVLSTTINRYMYICVNKKFDNQIRVSYSKTENVHEKNQIKHPIVRETLNFMNIDKGIEISSLADIPKGSGLGSSSSYTVGLLNAIYSYQNKSISKEKLAYQACKIEIDHCKEPIGKQDQYAATYGGINLICFRPDDTVIVNRVNCSLEIIDELNKSILLFFTGITRSASTTLLDQNLNMDIPYKRDIIKKMIELAYKMKDQLENGNLSNFGKMLDENWKLKASLTSNITNSQINRWYKIGLENGALGGKILGAGNGGFLMFFAPSSCHKKIKLALNDLKFVKVELEDEGSKIVYKG